ncbi:uncharacterized protein KQ657_004322 [Scheffersomyces spartinae]|uniref:Hap4 transcription factor heteromerisation domain-containing protein n=1 Tax=Scheffersomyces spartinae TaxID=45513 RepID=A0A9P7VBU0_9ASCO|nr:uncharacterized protein KQ657_004322 [Scheffersomyces spartinae]KAG7194646.1 hypothetical protein KQ657_004322 [Scheffersomyces spartinae]
MSAPGIALGDDNTLSRSASPVVVPVATGLSNSISQTSSVQRVNINLNKGDPQRLSAMNKEVKVQLQHRPPHQLEPHIQQQQRYAKIQPAIKPRPIAVLPKPQNAIKSKFDPSVPTTSQIKSSLHNNTPLNINTSKKWILPPRPRPGRKPTASANGGSPHASKNRTAIEHSHLQHQSNTHHSPHTKVSLSNHQVSNSTQNSGSSFHNPRRVPKSSPPPAALKLAKKPILPLSSTTAKNNNNINSSNAGIISTTGTLKSSTSLHVQGSQSNTIKKSMPSSSGSPEKKLTLKKKLKPMTKESENETIINQLKQQYPQRLILTFSSKVGTNIKSNTESGLNTKLPLISSASSLADSPSSNTTITPSTISKASGAVQPKNPLLTSAMNSIRKISPAPPGPPNSAGSLSGVIPTPAVGEPKRTLLDLKGIYLNKLKEQELIRNYIDVINNQIKELNFVKNGVITFAALDGNNNGSPVTSDADITATGGEFDANSTNHADRNDEDVPLASRKLNKDYHGGMKTTRKPVSCEQLQLINNLNDLNKFLTYFLKSSSIIHSATKKYVNGNKPDGTGTDSNMPRDKSDIKAEHKRQLDALDQQIRYYLELRERFQVKSSSSDQKPPDSEVLGAADSDDSYGQRKLKMKKVNTKKAESEPLPGDFESAILNALVKEQSFPFGDPDTVVASADISDKGRNVIRNDVAGLLPPGGLNSLQSPSSFAPNLFKSTSVQDDELIDFLNSESEKTDTDIGSNKHQEKPNDKAVSNGKRFSSPLLAQYERQLGDDIGPGPDDDESSVSGSRDVKQELDHHHIMNLDKLMLHDGGTTSQNDNEDSKTESEELKMHSLLMDQDNHEMNGFFGLRGFGSSGGGMELNGGSRNKCGFCGSDSPCFCLEGDIM